MLRTHPCYAKRTKQVIDVSDEVEATLYLII